MYDRLKCSSRIGSIWLILSVLAFFYSTANAQGTGVFLRFKVNKPASNPVRVTVTGYLRSAPWRFPQQIIDMPSQRWSSWIDLSDWKWHGRMMRTGGVSEYPAIMLRVHDLEKRQRVYGCEFEVEISDKPEGAGFKRTISEGSTENSIVFLLPYPLRENIGELETGNEAAERHAKWAREANQGKPPKIRRFEIATNLVLDRHPDLAEKEAGTLVSMGFNTIGGVPASVIKKFGTKTFGGVWSLHPDPIVTEESWQNVYRKRYERQLATEDGRLKYSNFAYFAISDEIRVTDFRRAEKARVDAWFREYLRDISGSDRFFGRPISSIEYPLDKLAEPALERTAPTAERRVLYHAAKFGQIWTIGQVGQTASHLKGLFPEVKTNTLVPSHGFFGNAWGTQFIGMSYRMLDLFELGRLRPVEQVSVEDWFGLNHMYGPSFTWTGAQSFGYYNALVRSAVSPDTMLRGFLTPSDDKYLRLKAYASLGQGAKALYFWSYGPTMVATENYWSDLRSEYDGVVKINRAIEKSEDVLLASETVTDDVAILYSVSHDIWNTDQQSAFVEKRLLWHGLRHLQFQPEFVDEKSVASGSLSRFKVLFITDAAISRAATTEIEAWVRKGGVLYLSAGAATRDEYFERYLPPFAKAVFKNDSFVVQPGDFNERTTLKTVKPLSAVEVTTEQGSFALPVLGGRNEVVGGDGVFAKFSDGSDAGRVSNYGKGKIVAVGFMPMLAYGRSANFSPTALKEQWQPEPRSILSKTLDLAGVDPVAAANVPVVETNLLSGKQGLAIVLVNYTYKPIDDLTITIRTGRRVTKATSTDGKNVRIVGSDEDQTVIKLPLEWTDIVILE